MIVRRSSILGALAICSPIPTLWACGETLSIPSSGPDVAAFVPAGFKIINHFQNDFNGDGLVDSLVLIVPQSEEECRPLLVLFKRTGGGYELSARADEIMVGSGGVHSGPVGEIEIRKDTFVVTHFTGSTMVQNSSHSQFQFRDNGWRLIGNKLTANMPSGESDRAGLKASSGEVIVSYSVDSNLLNGDQEEVWDLINTVTEEERTVVKRTKQPVKPPVRLEQFNHATRY